MCKHHHLGCDQTRWDNGSSEGKEEKRKQTCVDLQSTWTKYRCMRTMVQRPPVIWRCLPETSWSSSLRAPYTAWLLKTPPCLPFSGSLHLLKHLPKSFFLWWNPFLYLNISSGIHLREFLPPCDRENVKHQWGCSDKDAWKEGKTYFSCLLVHCSWQLCQLVIYRHF